MEKKPLMITETILRDAHQSQAATRMRIEDMLPACELLDNMGYWSLECWGGATFDVCMRFLNEDPWERLRTLKAHMPKTKLQMLFRGQNILGYKHYADDVVEEFCQKSIENGIDVVRVFDALNDIRNLRKAVESVKKYGGWAEVALSFTVSPVHNDEYFVNIAKELEKMGADSICIKDMANLLLPFHAYDLVRKLKDNVTIPIHLHTHNTAGTGDMVNLMAAQAGVDIVDCALSPLANGTSQPATESLVATLQGTDRDTGLDLVKLNEAATHFRKVADRLKKEGLYENTVIIFGADHGSHFKTRNRDGHLNGYDDYKRSGHDAALRVPLVIAGGPFKGGKVEAQIVSTASLPKTILALAGVDVGDKMIGENLADVVAGNTPNRVNEAFAQISESRCGRCIRTPDFLYAVYAPGVNGGEAAAADVYADDYLYDLRVDPVQLNNVVADPAYAEAKAMLRGRLLDWIKRAEGAEPTIVD